MNGIHICSGDRKCIVAPMIGAAVAVYQLDVVEQVLSAVDVQVRIRQTDPGMVVAALSRLLRVARATNNPKPFDIWFRYTGVADLSRYGIEIASNHQIEYLRHCLEGEILYRADIGRGLDVRNPGLILGTNVAQRIAYYYSRNLRQQFLEQRGNYYPMLELPFNRGQATDKHLMALSQLEYLPPFYIKSQVYVMMQTFIEETGIVPSWYPALENS